MTISDLQFEVLEATQGLEATPKNLDRLGRSYPPTIVRWAMVQWELRSKAAKKFALAEKMLFTPEALEQATHEEVAAWRASRFPEGSLVADLTCGIGGDLIALAHRGPVAGFDLDPERVACAKHNLAVHGLDAEVLCEDSNGLTSQFEYVMLDPGRRQNGARVGALAEYQPDPRFLAKHADRMKLAAIKLSPLVPDHELEALGSLVEFVSFKRECREALVWLGKEAPSGKRAVRVETGAMLDACPNPIPAPTLAEFVLDSDPAAVRGHALGHFGLHSVGDHPGYLTAPVPCESEWLTSWRVLWEGSGKLKEINGALRSLDSGTPELKQRGAGLNLTEIRSKLLHKGSRRLTVIFWTESEKLRSAITERYPDL